MEELPEFLSKTAPVPALTEDLPWNHPRELSEPISRPLRGRSQEIPYLKSLMLGFSAPAPMERIVLLQGEEGVGKEHLAAWACAVAEGEGIWVHHLGASAGESCFRGAKWIFTPSVPGPPRACHSKFKPSPSSQEGAI